MTTLQDQTSVAQDTTGLLARIAELEAANARLSQAKATTLSCKVGDKGNVCVYGLGRFPVSLYLSQWERLIPFIPQVEAFIAANRGKLSVKGE